MVEFGQEKLVWSILAGKSGFDRKNWFRSILAEKNGLRRFWPEKLGFDRKKLIWAHLGSLGLIVADWGSLLGRTDFFPKSAPSSGKPRFSVFHLGPEFLQVPVAQNGPKTTVNHPLRPPGGPTEKKVVPEKVAENHPG